MSVDDISLEPLLNQSAEGDGISRRLAFVPIDSVGAASNRSVVPISTTPVEVAIGTGKRTIEIYNEGANTVYYGGSGVTASTGIPLYKGQTKIYANVKDTFSLYFICNTAESCNLRIVEYA